MKNYYDILELTVGAEPHAIRASFRRLAKLYHPDVSQHPLAHERFMEIQEAYEFLIDDAQRANFIKLWNQQYADRQEQFRREQIYKLWLQHQKINSGAKQTRVYDQFKKGERLSAFWLKVHWVANATFLIFFILMILIPAYRYFHQEDIEEALRKPFVFFMWPMAIGSIFLVVGYYYWFVQKTDRYL